MKTITMLLGLGLAATVAAHDEGHGPKLTDAPVQGGVLTAVVEAKDAKLGPKAKLVYKAELVRLEGGQVRVYLYDATMKPLDLKAFGRKAGAKLLVEAKGKVKATAFTLTLDLAEGAFAGKSPVPSRKPYNIDVTMTEGKRSLLAAFDGLD